MVIGSGALVRGPRSQHSARGAQGAGREKRKKKKAGAQGAGREKRKKKKEKSRGAGRRPQGNKRLFPACDPCYDFTGQSCPFN
jgi:hypothetical protein